MSSVATVAVRSPRTVREPHFAGVVIEVVEAEDLVTPDPAESGPVVMSRISVKITPSGDSARRIASEAFVTSIPFDVHDPAPRSDMGAAPGSPVRWRPSRRYGAGVDGDDALVTFMR